LSKVLSVPSRRHFPMQNTAYRPKIIVSAGGSGMVSQAGALLLAQVLQVTGLARQLSAGLARWRAPRAVKPAQDREIRRMHDSGDYNVAEIAALFSVSRPTVYRSLERTTELPPLPADTRPCPTSQSTTSCSPAASNNSDGLGPVASRTSRCPFRTYLALWPWRPPHAAVRSRRVSMSRRNRP